VNRFGAGHQGIPREQRGFLLMTAVILIVTVALLATVITFLSTGNVLSSAGHANSAQALFIAESGLERGIYGYKNGTWCTSLGSLVPPGTVGEGDFTITGTFNIASVALGANITATDTVIPVASTAGFASHGRIRIENEDMDYTALTATSYTGAKRGVAGSAAAAHNTGATVNVVQNECVIRSTGTVATGNTRRVVEKGIQNPGAMMVYAKANGDGNVYYRRWDGANWGPERTATAVPSNIHYFVLKFARTRNEAILGTMSSGGDIRVQVWNGNTQTWSATTLLANVGGDSAYRGFDIEYETVGDRAIVVYNDGTADPNYRIWNGTAWSGATNINIPTTGNARWIGLTPHPRSDEIMMITLDANADVYGMRWPGGAAAGAAWDNMGVAGVWDASAANAGASKAIDVAYEQSSGEALFMWGDAVASAQYYRTWNGTTLSGNTLLTIGAMGGTANRIRLAPNPFSDQIMYAAQDGNRDLFTAIWSGAAWTVHATHDTNTEDANDRNFDVVFETHPSNSGKAWLVWGTRAGADFTARRSFSGGAWSAIVNYGDDAALVQLLSPRYTGEVLATVYQDTSSVTDDITEAHLTNGSSTWSAETVIWGGSTVANPVYNRVFLAPERYVSIVDWREIFQ
jgi:hypothetical protein